MIQERLVVTGGLVLDSDALEFRGADVLIEDSHFVDIGAPGAFETTDARRIEAKDRLVIPGLVNAHSHGHGFFSKGLNREWPLELLIAAAPWITAERGLELMRLSTLIGGAEMLMKGCTATADLHSQLPLPTAHGFRAIAESYREVGLRATIAPMVADIPFWLATPGLAGYLADNGATFDPAPRPADCDVIAEAVRAAVTAIPDDAFTKPAICAAIPLSCSDALLAALSGLARDRGIILHTHLLESPLQGPFWTAERGGRLSAALDSRGLLDERFVAAHSIWLDDEDLRLLADRGCMVAHNPVSNMRLGTGIAPLRAMLDRGISVGIGTDTCSCGDNLNLFEAMRTATGLSRLVDADAARWVTPREIFRSATLDGARIIDREGEIGKIAAGYRADFVCLDMNAPHYLPLNDPLAQIVHAEDGTGVDRVFVGGTEVVRHGRLLTIDLAACRSVIDDANSAFLERVTERRREFDRLAPLVARFRIEQILAQSGKGA